MGSVIQGFLNLPGRRLSIAAAQGSLHSCVCVTRSNWRPTVEVETSWRRTRMQLGVRGYANSSTDILEENKSEVNSEIILSSADTSVSKRQSAVPLEVQALPKIPPLPTKPTPHITLKDVTTYIQPLVSRQWKVGHICTAVSEDEILDLNRRYQFKGFNDAMDFVQGIANISRAEKHHARTVIEYDTVTIFLHTHTAYIFYRVGEGEPVPKKVPGLTRRDIRFAIQVEELHETFKEQGRMKNLAVSTNLIHLQHRSMGSLLRRYDEKQTVAKTEDAHSTSPSN
ncbi:hypothetical protein BDR07DRAFT_1396664 [Suillus spraguei]|nr:hypothetical protein BDR07DRAFT_1396664 [Suillus spraguei]